MESLKTVPFAPLKPCYVQNPLVHQELTCMKDFASVANLVYSMIPAVKYVQLAPSLTQWFVNVHLDMNLYMEAIAQPVNLEATALLLQWEIARHARYALYMLL